MAKTWMAAAGENGIPAAFIIRDGKIAWIGHPMGMDQPLAQITAGQWDAAAQAKTRLAAKTAEQKVMAVQSKVYTPYGRGDYKATLAAIEEVTSGDPDLADHFAGIELDCLSKTGRVEQALELGNRFLKKHHDEAMALNNTFFPLIDLKAKEPDPRIAKLALEAARRADELTGGKDVNVLDTLAVALYRAGEPAEAAATEEKALKRLESEVSNEAHPYFKIFKDQIETFRKAAAGKSGKAGKP
jgi:tetratricopeptide (TPR) repeat protein